MLLYAGNRDFAAQDLQATSSISFLACQDFGLEINLRKTVVTAQVITPVGKTLICSYLELTVINVNCL